MSDIEKRADDLLAILPTRTREILRALSRRDCRSELQELVWLIEARGAGRLRDAGDADVIRLIPLNQIPEIHQVLKTEVRLRSDELDSPGL
jgi:hypothetical protein